MSERVVIIDYGSGNLRSAVKAFERSAHEADLDMVIELTSHADRVRNADRIVLPGVGAFADCRAGLDAVPDMVDVLNEKVRDGDTPFLGICVGMQLMATRGLEKTTTEGLGWIEGDVVALDPADKSLKIPQIGWNTLAAVTPHPLLEGIELEENGLHAYYVHSYHMALNDSTNLIATSQYGQTVTGIVGRDNMVGTQFHPEKSQTLGLALISNFLRWKP